MEKEKTRKLDFINQQNANFVFDNSKSKLKVLFFYIFIFKVDSKNLEKIFFQKEINKIFISSLSTNNVLFQFRVARDIPFRQLPVLE